MALIIRATPSAGAVHIGRPGLYDAKVSGIRQDQLTSTFGTNDVVRITCKVLDVMDEQGEDVHIDAIANWLLSPMSKLWGWLENLGLKPEIDFDIDLEQAVGKDCVLSIVDYRNPKDQQLISRVDGIFPPRRQAKVTTAENLLTPTGGINWTAFWAEASRRQITREMVADALGGDINAIAVMPIADVMQLLEDLRGV